MGKSTILFIASILILSFSVALLFLPSISPLAVIWRMVIATSFVINISVLGVIVYILWEIRSIKE